MYFAENQKRIPIFPRRRRPLAGVTLAYQKSECDTENPVKAEQYKSGTEIERKGASQMNNRSNLRGSFGNLLHRGVSLALASAMSLSLLPATAWAASSTSASANTSAPAVGATQVTDKSEFPKIEFQLNIVRTEYGTLNGTAELSLCAGPSGETDAEGNAVTSVSFHTLATNLRFNTELLTPVDWEWVADLSNITADPGNNKIDLKLDSENNAFNKYYQVAIPAKKDDTLPTTGAIAQCGIVENAPTGMSTNVAGGTEAMLFFKAEAYDQPITLTKMTTLAVIRFKVNNDLMKHLSITPSDTPEADGKYTYTLHSDLLTGTDDTVTTMKLLNDAVTAGTTDLSLNGFETVVGFAEDKDISLSDPERGLALYYSTGASKNEYYYVPDMTTDKVGTTAAGNATDSVKVTIGGTEYTLTYPNTVNTDDMILAVDSTKADGDADKYSYTSNLIPNTNISFTVVSEMSYADQGVDLDKYSVLVFVDWDNTLLGTLVVPKYENVTSLVNEYVRSNFVHPQLKDNPNYSSIARVDTYRGKYIATTPSAESDTDNTVVTDGEKYPLTNKLDYAFLRRPMERATTTDDSGAVVPTAENTWVQKSTTNGTTTTAVYDTKYPYAYGWAKCTAENYTEVWTTLGTTGELNSWDAGDGTTTVATVTSTDSAFEIADLESGLGKNDSTVFLKAIYEPGDDLGIITDPYRLYTTPAYNKLNASPAVSGGAYSVTLQYERVVDGDQLRGAVRMRDPYVRLQTSTDYRWKEEAELGVYNNLTNPTLNDAANDMTETTYIRMDVDNSEVMDVSLTLSAKHNKVDYLLIDCYGGNFISGGQRSVSNFASGQRTDDVVTATGSNANIYRYGKGEADYVIDNYNYYVATDKESENRDPSGYFADVMSFDDKEGSHGFVLYGTLNNLMQKATEYAQVKNNVSATVAEKNTASAEFNNYSSTDIMNDINLKDTNGADPDFLTNLELMREAIVRAAELCAQYKGQSNESDYWDSRLDCARLTYHQLQWFIIDYTANGASATLLDPVTADDAAHKLSWCHLHSTCAAGQQKKPTTWEAFINLAKGDTDDQMAIATMTVDEFESLTRLRADSDGSKFTNPTQFKNAVVNAIASLALGGAEATWENVQYAILNPAYDGSTGGPGAVYPESVGAKADKATYWWYDGATSVEIDGWSEADPATGTSLMTALKDATATVTYPDGTSHTTQAKIDNLEKSFDKGLDNAYWVNATHNLATKYDVDTDTPSLEGDFAMLKTKLLNAYTALTAEGKLSGDEQTVWKRVQHYVLNGIVPATDADLGDYWWYDGNFKIKDVNTLFRAVNEGGSAWENFDLTTLQNELKLDFRTDFKGTNYDATTFDSVFKPTMEAYVSAVNASETAVTVSWESVQYYLIYDVLPGAGLSYDSAYYWWKEDGTAAQVEYALNAGKSEIRADSFAKTLSKAAFLEKFNGYGNAFGTITAEMVNLGRLIGSYSATDDFAAQTLATESQIKTALDSLLVAANWSGPVTGANPAPTFTWEQIQEEILDADYPTDDNGAWWKKEDKNPANKENAADVFNNLKVYIKAVAEAWWLDETDDLDNVDAPLANFLSVLTEDVAGTIGLMNRERTALISSAELSATEWKWVDYSVFIDEDTDEFTDITWYDLQYLIIRGDFASSSDKAKKYIVETYSGIIPQWVKDLEAMGSALYVMPITDLEVDNNGMSVVSSVSETELPGGLLLRVETRTVVDLIAHTAVTTTITTLFDADGNILSQTISETVTDLPTDSDDAVYDVDKDTDLIVPGTDGDGNDSYENEKDTVVIPAEPDYTEGDHATATDKNTEGNHTGDNNAENTPAGTDRNDSYKNDKDAEVTPVKPGSTTGSSDDPYENEDDTILVVTSLQSENEIENSTTNQAKTVTNPPKKKSITDNNGEAAEGKSTAVTSPAQNSDENTVTTPVVNSAPQPKASPLSNNNDVVNDAVTTTVTPTDTTDTASTEKSFSGYEIVTVIETPPPVVGAPTLPASSEETPSAGCYEVPAAPWQSQAIIRNTESKSTFESVPIIVPYSVITTLNCTSISGNWGLSQTTDNGTILSSTNCAITFCVPYSVPTSYLLLRGAEGDAAISHLWAYSKSQETEQQTEISRLGVNSMSLQRNRTYPPRGQAIVSTEQLTTTKGGAAK